MAFAILVVSCGPRTSSKTEVAPEVDSTPAKYVALSFDDGPNDITTPKVLDILEGAKMFPAP